MQFNRNRLAKTFQVFSIAMFAFLDTPSNRSQKEKSSLNNLHNHVLRISCFRLTVKLIQACNKSLVIVQFS